MSWNLANRDDYNGNLESHPERGDHLLGDCSLRYIGASRPQHQMVVGTHTQTHAMHLDKAGGRFEVPTHMVVPYLAMIIQC